MRKEEKEKMWKVFEGHVLAEGLREALALQEASPLPHGHLAGVGGGVEVDGGVVDGRLRDIGVG